MAIQTVGVVGCGLMGSGIAQIAAEAGYAVIVREVDAALLAKGRGKIESFLKKAVEKGKATPGPGDRDARSLHVDHRARRPREVRPRGRGDPREHAGEAGALEVPRREVPAAHDLLEQHLVALDRRHGGVHEAPPELRRAALLQPRPADEAGRGRPHDLHVGRDLPGRVRVRHEDREDGGDREGHPRVRRQPAAGALPARRDPRVREGRRLGEGHRQRHEARLRPPDGPARAARLRRARHDALHRRHHVARVQGHPLRGARRSCAAWSRRGCTARSRAAASTTTRRRPLRPSRRRRDASRPPPHAAGASSSIGWRAHSARAGETP